MVIYRELVGICVVVARFFGPLFLLLLRSSLSHVSNAYLRLYIVNTCSVEIIDCSPYCFFVDKIVSRQQVLRPMQFKWHRQKRFKQNEWLRALRPCCYHVKQKNKHVFYSHSVYVRNSNNDCVMNVILTLNAHIGITLFPLFKNNTIQSLRCFK